MAAEDTKEEVDAFEVVEASVFDDGAPSTLIENSLACVAEGINTLTTTFDNKITSVDDNLSTVVESMTLSNDNFDSKISSVDSNLKAMAEALKSSNQNMASMKSAIASMNDSLAVIKWELEEERKKKTLERAAMLSHLGSFTYYWKNGNTWVEEESSEYVKRVLQWFLLGQGCTLPEEAAMSDSCNGAIALQRSKKEFRDNLVKQIKDLINKEPRLNVTGSKYSIFYS